MTLLSLATIRLDGGTQPRALTDAVTIEDYARDMLKGDAFPPLVVFYDGEHYWLTSGFHRYSAAAFAGFEEMDCDVRQGTRRDAVLFSCGLNSEHGLRRTNDDKRRAVRKLLEDGQWRTESDQWIATAARVTDRFVAAMRDELYPPASPNRSGMRTVHRGDQTYQMNVGGMVRRPGLFDAEEGRPVPVSAGPAPQRPIGHREVDERSRTIAWAEALRAIVTAQRILPDPRLVVVSNPDVSPDTAFHIAAWWAKFAAELRGRVERAS